MHRAMNIWERINAIDNYKPSTSEDDRQQQQQQRINQLKESCEKEKIDSEKNPPSVKPTKIPETKKNDPKIVGNSNYFDEIRKRNFSHQWAVKAQAVCSNHYACRIKEIQYRGRTASGAAIFSIAWELKGKSAGSSGVMSIECGFDRSNSLRSTSVNAICQ